MSKYELVAMVDRLRPPTPEAVEECIAFFETESFGMWHNRARAKIARRLKHCELTPRQRHRVVDAVLNRLKNGWIREQFKDQLRLVLKIDSDSAFAVAYKCRGDSTYIRRFAEWVLAHKRGE